MSEDLHRTVISQWRDTLVGAHIRGKAHWRTKVSYYRAVSDLLGARTGLRPSWREVVARVEPRGSRTTFYDVTGPHARYPLFGALADSDDPQVMQLAWCYRRVDAVDHLIDEAKVWSYWMYRDVMLERLRSTTEPDALLSRALTDWARDHPALAAALDCAPPACAVEDMVRLRPGAVAAIRAYESLTAMIHSSLRPPVDA